MRVASHRSIVGCRLQAIPEDPLEYAQLLIKEYIAYPLPRVRVPYNFCVAPLALPADAFYQPALRWLLRAAGCS